MFEKMMKYEKTFNEFCGWARLYFNYTFFDNKWWIKDEYGDTILIKNELSILSIMPFFFDEYKIYIKSFIFYGGVVDDVNKKGYRIEKNNRKNILIESIEKAFEILNKQLEDK